MKNKLSTFLILLWIMFCVSDHELILADNQINKYNSTEKQTNEIQLPADENWYDEGDEEFYKFNLKQNTPKEGITGGYLIYYGHFIKPPYKVEYKNGEIMVNGIFVNRRPEVLNKRLKEKDRREHPPLKFTDEELRSMKTNNKKKLELENTLNEILSRIVNQYDEPEKHKQEIFDEMKKYLKGESRVEYYEHTMIYCLVYKSVFNTIRNETCVSTKKEQERLKPPTQEERKAREKEVLNVWKYKLSKYIVFERFCTIPPTSNNEQYIINISNIITSNLSKIDKTRELYKLIDCNSSELPKYLLYNFTFLNEGKAK